MSVSNTADIEYTLLLLSDGNLPTGAFVASSGLESYLAHGFGAASDRQSMMPFVRSSLSAYAASALTFVHNVHQLVLRHLASDVTLDEVLIELHTIDELYHTTLLNEPARRASKAQGVALLTLYTKGLSSPDAQRQATLVDKFKLLVRKGSTPGHLPTCWAILTAVIALPADRTAHLHLFLHVRGLLSAAIRLNALGPYAAQQLLAHDVRPLIEREMDLHRARLAEAAREKDTTARVLATNPACTWPLGEILAARHDLQHSRIFNS
ncbi:urease accessory protein UreF [Auriculariales sp. MPI-PUGE-AT-0066]|nr:urease accessory protein UreF [Auriculariales sp. MPI-PUGE-AT-0066]